MNHEEAMAELTKEFEIESGIIGVCEENPNCAFSPCQEYWALRAKPSPKQFVPSFVEKFAVPLTLPPGAIIPVAAEEEVQKRQLVLPTDAAARNEYPMFDGLIGYFPNALAAIARLSFIANEQHNPGEPLHWAIGKSKDHANKIVKHLLDHGHMDTDGTRHSTKLGWRALALLEEELVAAGAPRGRNAY